MSELATIPEAVVAGERELATERAGVDELVGLVAELAVEDEDGAELAADAVNELRGRRLRLEEARKRATRPLMQGKAEIDGWFKPVVDVLEKAERELKGRLARYRDQEERRRRAELEAARAAAEGAARAGDGEMAAAALEVAAEACAPARVAGVDFREAWDFEVEDPELVPREWLLVDVPRVRRAVQSSRGAVSIPGVRVFKVTQVAARCGR